MSVMMASERGRSPCLEVRCADPRCGTGQHQTKCGCEDVCYNDRTKPPHWCERDLPSLRLGEPADGRPCVPRWCILPTEKIIQHSCSYVKGSSRKMWESMSDQFGKKVRHVRLKKGMTQTDVADLLTASGSHISNMEAGRKAPSLDTVVRIADAFRITTDYLLRDTIPIEDIAECTLSPNEKRDSAFTLLSTKLRHLRTQRHIHQADLAHQLGLRTQAHISLLEAGHKEPSISLLLRLADFFGVTTDYLLRDDISVSADETPEE